MKSEIKQRIDQLNNGEIPDGYKKTEFGVFPCDWVTDKTFGDLFDFYGGLSKSRDELGEEGYAYLHYGDLHRGSFNCVSLKRYSQLPKCDIVLKGKETCLMEDGDVAFLDASEDLEGTSRAVLIDNPDNDPFIAGLHIIFGKSKGDSLEKWYKQYITSSESVKKQFQRLSVGFKVYGVNRDALPKIRIAYPTSLQEQSRIADVLMKWDEAIELYQQQIEKLNKLKRSSLAKLFPQKGQTTPKYRFAGFTDPWEQRKLLDCLSQPISDGPHETPDLVDEGVPFISVDAIVDNKIDFERKRGYITDKYDLECRKKYSPQRDDVYLVKSGSTVGKVAIVETDERFNIWSPLAAMRANKEVLLPKYLYYFLQLDDIQDEVLEKSKGGTQPNLSMRILEKFIVRLPHVEEQKKISDSLSNLDNLITIHQRKIDTVAKQRAVLQQYLLNGIVRVKNE